MSPRLTKIICTLGPSSADPDRIKALAANGMDIARINFSHGSQEGHRKTIHAVKEVREANGLSIALLLDTKGAEIRTGDRETPLVVKAGEEVVFSATQIPTETRPLILVNYPHFASDVAKAECILLENGALPFDIVRIDGESVIATARNDGSIGSRRHVNLPGADVSLPSLTDQDWSDLEMGIQEEMDFVALSFIRTAEEVKEVRAFIDRHTSHMQIIVKVETRQAVDDIERIIDAADGIMVARGDLGAEMPYQRIPAVQDSIVSLCRQAGKPVIVATHMLESMIEHPMPTRAEVTDIAHAATTRADSTMLSGETAAGKHPIESVRAMRTILEETESILPVDTTLRAPATFGRAAALADAAVSMARAVQAQAIIVFTRSGATARAVSTLRPGIPIIALTQSATLQRQLLLWHGIFPLVITFDKNPETSLDTGFTAIKPTHLLPAGQTAVVITDTLTHQGPVHTVHIRTMPTE